MNWVNRKRAMQATLCYLSTSNCERVLYRITELSINFIETITVAFLVNREQACRSTIARETVLVSIIQTPFFLFDYGLSELSFNSVENRKGSRFRG